MHGTLCKVFGKCLMVNVVSSAKYTDVIIMPPKDTVIMVLVPLQNQVQYQLKISS